MQYLAMSTEKHSQRIIVILMLLLDGYIVVMYTDPRLSLSIGVEGSSTHNNLLQVFGKTPCFLVKLWQSDFPPYTPLGQSN